MCPDVDVTEEYRKSGSGLSPRTANHRGVPDAEGRRGPHKESRDVESDTEGLLTETNLGNVYDKAEKPSERTR